METSRKVLLEELEKAKLKYDKVLDEKRAFWQKGGELEDNDMEDILWVMGPYYRLLTKVLGE